ncbi:putative phosphoribosylpyrophosphate synthetase [Diplonema papillatum]|nr:putative phosphoribosylpyrophosphate synthetase [Diplonema papillatum]
MALRITAAPNAMDSATRLKLVGETIAEVIWSARRDDWEGTADSHHLQILFTNAAFLLEKAKAYVTKSFCQALYSIMRRAVASLEGGPKPIRRHPLTCGIYATRLLTKMVEKGMTPNLVPDPVQFPGQNVTDDLLLAGGMQGIDLLCKGWIQKKARATHQVVVSFFNSLWLLVGHSAPLNPRSVLRCLHHSMTDPVVGPLVGGSDTLPTFIIATVNVLHWLPSGNVDNWQNLVVQLATALLQLQRPLSLRISDLAEQNAAAASKTPPIAPSSPGQSAEASGPGPPALPSALKKNPSSSPKTARVVEGAPAAGGSGGSGGGGDGVSESPANGPPRESKVSSPGPPRPISSRQHDGLLPQPKPNPFDSLLLVGPPGLSAAGGPLWLGSLSPTAVDVVFAAVADFTALLSLTSRLFQQLLSEPTQPAGISERIFGVGDKPNALRTAVVKALLDGEKTAVPSTVYAGVLAAAVHSKALLSSSAVKAVDGLATRFLDLEEVSAGVDPLPAPLRRKIQQHCHVYACAALQGEESESNPYAPAAVRIPANPALRERFADTFVGLQLADEILHRDAARADLSKGIPPASPHAKQRQPFFASPSQRHALLRLLRALSIPAEASFYKRLEAHSASVHAHITASFNRSVEKRTNEMVATLGFFTPGYRDVLFAVQAAAPQNDRVSAPEGLPESCVAILRNYFAVFPHTSLPPLPASVLQSNSPEAQERKKKALVERGTFHVFKATLASFVRYQQRASKSLAGGTPYSDEVISNVFRADADGKTDPMARYPLQFWLFCLSLIPSTSDEIKALTPVAPRLLRFIRPGYDTRILVTAHAIIIKLLGEPTRDSVICLSLYINACLPVRPKPRSSADVAAGSPAVIGPVNTRLLPSLELLKEFTKHIRGLCQKVEEWDVGVDSLQQARPQPPGEAAAAPREAGKKPEKDRNPRRHASGVGLVLYVVEALRKTILGLSSEEHRLTAELSRKRRLYIGALINLLQCLNSEVLTKVCASLESVLSSQSDISEVTFWLQHTSKAIKNSHNPSTKQQVVEWFLRLQALLRPQHLGIQAKL